MSSLPARLAAWLLGLLLLVGAGFACADEPQAIPPLAARVTDLTRTLGVDQRQRIDARLAAFENARGSQIAVLIVPTVQPESIEQYALRVVESWKLGRRGVDDGALLLIAKNDRKLRIEVGYGLEGALNDATAKRIISETISPRFKKGDFYGGIDAGVAAMVQVIAGEALPPAAPVDGARRADVDDHFEMLLLIGFVLVFVIGGVLRAILGRFLAAGMVGVAAGVIAAMLISSLLIAAVLGVVAAIVSLFLGMRGGSGWSSGGISWGGGGGRGSGGFSGGGGSFGGGGASGDW